MNIRRTLAVGLLLIPLGLATAACGGITRPSGWASPAVDGSNAYIFEKKDRLAALSLQDSTATTRWTFPDDNKQDQKDIKLEAVYGQPIIQDATLYFGSYGGELFAIDPANGDLRRARDIGGHIAGGLASEGGQFAFATTEGQLFLVKASDFTPADGWDSRGKSFGEGIWTTPVLTRDRIYLATMKGNVIALDRATGNELWRFKASGAIPSITLLDDNHLFAAGLGKKVYILDPENGNKQVEFTADDWVWNKPAFKDGVAYFGDFSGKVYALDITRSDGTAKWVYDTGEKIKAGPVLVDDVLVVADRAPVVHFVNIADGNPLNTVPLEAKAVNADLIVDDANAMMVTTDGRLFRADPRARQVTEIVVGGGQ